MKKLMFAVALVVMMSSHVRADSLREYNYYTQARIHATNLWNAIYFFTGKSQAEWNALNYGSTLSDGTREHTGLTKVEIGAVVFDTANAIKALFDGGHASNVAKLLLPSN